MKARFCLVTMVVLLIGVGSLTLTGKSFAEGTTSASPAIQSLSSFEVLNPEGANLPQQVPNLFLRCRHAGQVGHGG